MAQARVDLAPGLRMFPVGNYLIFFRGDGGLRVPQRRQDALDFAPDTAAPGWRAPMMMSGLSPTAYQAKMCVLSIRSRGDQRDRPGTNGHGPYVST
jgi:hypothetical protein